LEDRLIVIIAGSRRFIGKSAYSLVAEAVVESGFDITEVVSGTARGIDNIGEEWARNNNVPVRQFPAQWGKYGRVAGLKRNEAMAKYSEGLIAIWDGESRGTENMINTAKVNGLQVYVKTSKL
jgi:hypothetical protein